MGTPKGDAMTFERRIAALFRMDDRTWERHANPWSVWSRASVMPLLLIALWARVWFGWWALAALVAVLIWAFVNPRLFPPPGNTDNWASRAVAGERLWIIRDRTPLPERHRIVPHLLSAFAGIGFLAGLAGAVLYDPALAVCGTLVTLLAKFWFLDRMVWLHQDMKDEGQSGE